MADENPAGLGLGRKIEITEENILPYRAYRPLIGLFYPFLPTIHDQTHRLRGKIGVDCCPSDFPGAEKALNQQYQRFEINEKEREKNMFFVLATHTHTHSGADKRFSTPSACCCKVSYPVHRLRCALFTVVSLIFPSQSSPVFYQ